MKKTALHHKHQELGASLTQFADWEMPLQYSGIIAEHLAVREKAGLFDVSHMGELMLSGPASETFLQYLLTRDVSKLKPGRVTYALLCHDHGGVIDDLLVYRLEDEKFMLVVNAVNTEKVSAWITDHLNQNTWQSMLPTHVEKRVFFEDVSSQYALLALQGPYAKRIMCKVSNAAFAKLRPFQFLHDDKLADQSVLISRTGYTGEDGFEIYCPQQLAEAVWDKLMEAGSEHGLKPAGLGARDTLRLEAGLPLYGHELDERTTPLEAGLDGFVKLEKSFFIGRDAMMLKSKLASSRMLIGFRLDKKVVARQGCPIYLNDQKAGYVTSGGYSPCLQKSIGMALLSRSILTRDQMTGNNRGETSVSHNKTLEEYNGAADMTLSVEIRGKKFEIQRVELPFYRRSKSNPGE